MIKLQELYQYKGEGGNILQVNHPSVSVYELNTTTESVSEACKSSTINNYDFQYNMRWSDTMGNTTFPFPKCGGFYKDRDAALITYNGADQDTQLSWFSWVFISNNTTTQSDEGKCKCKWGKDNYNHKKRPVHTTQFRPTSGKERI